MCGGVISTINVQSMYNVVMFFFFLSSLKYNIYYTTIPYEVLWTKATVVS